MGTTRAEPPRLTAAATLPYRDARGTRRGRRRRVERTDQQLILRARSGLDAGRRERGDELEHFYHKSQQLGSAHSIFSKTPGGAAAICKAACAQIEFATDSPLEGGGFELPVRGHR